MNYDTGLIYLLVFFPAKLFLQNEGLNDFINHEKPHENYYHIHKEFAVIDFQVQVKFQCDGLAICQTIFQVTLFDVTHGTKVIGFIFASTYRKKIGIIFLICH